MKNYLTIVTAFLLVVLTLPLRAGEAVHARLLYVYVESSGLNHYGSTIKIKPRIDYVLLSDIDNRPLELITLEEDFVWPGTLVTHNLYIPAGTHVDNFHLQIRSKVGNKNTQTCNSAYYVVTPSSDSFTLTLETADKKYSAKASSHAGIIRKEAMFYSSAAPSSSISTDEWVSARKKEIAAAATLRTVYPEGRIRPTSVNVLIDNWGVNGSKDRQKIRLDYVIRSLSDNKVVEVKSWEKTGISKKELTLQAPSGCYIEQAIHVQYRQKSGDSWSNRLVGVTMVDSQNNVHVDFFCLDRTDGRVSTTRKNFYYDAQSSTSFIDRMKKIKEGRFADNAYGVKK